jgi:succinate-acetate transporter protein
MEVDMFMIFWGLGNMLIAVMDAYKDPDGLTIAWTLTGVFWIVLGAIRLYKQANLTTASTGQPPSDSAS